MEYEIFVEKDSNGRVIVDFYGLDFDITNEFVDGKCHKVIFGDPIVFVLKEAEAKDEPVENSNTAEEPPETHEEIPEPEHSEVSEEKHDEATEESETHEESVHSEDAIEYSPVEEHSTEDTDNHAETSEEAHADKKIEEDPISAPVENTEVSRPSDDSNNENTPVEEDAMEYPKETEHNPETQEGEN